MPPESELIVTAIGYWPALTVSGGVAETFTCVVPSASTVTVLAFAAAMGDAVTVQPCGPWAAKVKVCDSGVLFVTVNV